MRLPGALLPLAALLILRPESALSCGVCFGADSENAGLAKGLTWGLFLLLGSTFAVLGTMVVGVLRMERRRVALQAAPGGTR